MEASHRIGTLIGAGPTTCDHQACAQGRVILVNHALTLAPLFPEADFVSLHPEVFGKRPELQRDGITPVLGAWGAKQLPEDVRNKSHLFRGKQFALGDLTPEHVLDVEPSTLVHAACSTQVAIHLAWQRGVRELHLIGTHEYHGRPTAGYDPRLQVDAPYQPDVAAAAWYRECVRVYVALFPWANVCWWGH